MEFQKLLKKAKMPWVTPFKVSISEPAPVLLLEEIAAILFWITALLDFLFR